ncbi:MAG TPA: tryptophan--tRNA ligase [Mycobacteriales bacterium]|jgi:tryptophanyl-tRNA synthetase|nr:tryptophan--tRNA ligase [Mycobacteriales bacterium]
MPADRPRVLSGIQPTADSFHLGNYLGAVRQWVALQDSHDAFYCVVDLHAITVAWDPAELRQRTRVAAAQLLAAGLDPDRCTLFVQSHIEEHAQLGWVMSCLTGYGEASRMTQFKDKSSRQQESTVGLFTYPMLMAADILLYRAAQVPVGEDQRQHLELTRDLAQRFNARFGETFVVPEPFILKETGKIYDLQVVEKQMSKSIGGAGCLWLLDEPAVNAKKIKRAVTDTDTEIRFDPQQKPGVSNLLTILSALTDRTVADVVPDYAGKGYGALKTDVADAFTEFATPYRERTQRWLDDGAGLDDVLAAGAARARKVAAEMLAQAYDAVGFLPARG